MTQIKILALVFLVIFSSCRKQADEEVLSDIEETAQNIGDVMVSVDESGGGTGSIASVEQSLEKSVEKTFARWAPKDSIQKSALQKVLLPEAQAAACYDGSAGYGSCNTRTLIRTFADCSFGLATVSGTVTFQWAGGNSSTCSLGTTAGATLTRSPNFTVTGRRGATLAVTKTGSIGQRLTWASGASTSKVFNFTSDGINRKFTSADSAVLFDQTTRTTSAITITGTSRSSRVMDGGMLSVTNNLSGVSCSYVPSNVTWTSTSCNCPTQGSWSGVCTDSKSSTLTITGCGTGTLTLGNESTDVSFDRCLSGL